MTGMRISYDYYCSVCAPILESRIPDHVSRIAVGLVGEGSECFGFDDEISQDHAFGPRVCFFLTKPDYADFGAELEAVVRALPRSFLGMSVPEFTQNEGKRSGVFTVPEFYAGVLGGAAIPRTNEEWLAIPEARLATAVNGRVFRDPVGEFTECREYLLGHYPEDVRLYRLAEHAVKAGQTGQYNLVRSRIRQEELSVAVTKAAFAEHITAMFFLLNKKYMPYYKWAYRALRELSPEGEALHGRLVEFLRESEPRKEQALAEDIAGNIIGRMREQGLTTSRDGFLISHCPELLRRVESEELRRRPIVM